MSEFLGEWTRSHYAGKLREEHIDQQVTLMGWVQKRRNLGGLYFVDLRDREGIAQIVFDEDVSKVAFDKASTLTNESVIAVTGDVKKRQSVNNDIPTGQVEVFVSELKILSISEVPPIHISDEDSAGELLKLQYRYLDLRKPKMQRYLKIRHQIMSIAHDFFNEAGFINVETPILTKPTPEGARDYLVPSRVHPGKFYALPQSPQIFKQLLMVGGIDKYYQIARCFRDEDLRSDRQPEFTQLDIEMSFIDQQEIMSLNERFVKRLFKEILNVEFDGDFLRMSYAEAMEKYGSDKPDMRFEMLLNDVSELVKSCGFGVFESTVSSGGCVKGINVKGGADVYSKKAMKNLEKTAKKYGAKGLAWISFSDEEINSPIAKFLNNDVIGALKATFNAESGDLLLFVADKKSVVNNALGGLRLEAAKKLDLIKPDDYKVLWVENFPLFEYDEDDGRYYAKHHPFTSPLEEDLSFIESEPAKARAKAYDIVINGYEAGGGSIRIHRADLQKRMFKALGLSDDDINEKFGFLVEAFKYGTPPHGGLAFGVDRLTMILTGTDNIKDVIAFPKTQNATSPLTKAPAEASIDQLNELSIGVKIAKE